MAIVLPLLLLVVAGIVDFGRLFHAYEVVANAAREGARIRVLPGYDNNDAQARVTGYLDAAGLLADADTPAVAPVAIAPSATNNGWAVTVTYHYQPIILGPILRLFGANTLDSISFSATTAMRSEVTP